MRQGLGQFCRSLGSILLALISVMLIAGQAEAKRLALVVGNSAYQVAVPLKNADADAVAVGEALTRIGFEVTVLTDAPSEEFWAKLDTFATEAETAESTLFFYSGHAFQMAGVNYLVPVGAQLASRDGAKSEAWNLERVIARLQDRNRNTLIFLDACRNDALPASVRGTGAAEGLARVQTGLGTFVAFATEPGGVTFDGPAEAPNSPFTTALLTHLETPGISVSDMMIKVRNDVEEATLRKQSPWDQSSLRSQFYFVPEEVKGQELSEAEYDLLAELDVEDRKKFLDLLAAGGYSKESLEEAEAAIAVAEAGLEEVVDASTVIGGAAPVEEVASAEPAPEGGLEEVDSGIVLGAAPVVVAEAPPVETAPDVVASLEPQLTESAPTEAPVVVAGQDAPVATETPDAPIVIASAEPAPLAGSERAPIRLASLGTVTRDIALNALTIDRMRIVGRKLNPASPEDSALLGQIDPALLAPVQPEVAPEQLASLVQGELKRLGCYRMGVDGDWGKGSRTALASYFLAKRSVPDSLEPTQALYAALNEEAKVVCALSVTKVRPKLGAKKPEVVEKVAVKTRKKGERGGKLAAPERKQAIKKTLMSGSGFN